MRNVLMTLACAIALGAPPASAEPWAQTPTSSPADSTVRATAEDSLASRVDYLWVLRTSLVHREDMPRLVEQAKAMGVRGLLVQVVGRGDAWYRSDILPPPEALGDSDRDPLGELLPLAHAAGLEVHAWMNCCLVWSAPKPPRDPRHVLRAHPEWVARMADGRSMARLTPRERRRLQVEGVFLSPAHPRVHEWIASIAREIATRYPVDGIHLDYIRQPSVEIGYDQTSRARFALEYGTDPLERRGLSAAKRASLDSAWAGFQLDQVTHIVRDVRDSLTSLRPGLALSAAVLADSGSALKRNRQAWGVWLRTGLLDRAFLMCYAPLVQTVLDQLVPLVEPYGAGGRIVPGFAVYNSPPSAAAAKIKAARALGFASVALYSYDTLVERPDLWSRLRASLIGPTTPEGTP